MLSLNQFTTDLRFGKASVRSTERSWNDPGTMNYAPERSERSFPRLFFLPPHGLGCPSGQHNIVDKCIGSAKKCLQGGSQVLPVGFLVACTDPPSIPPESLRFPPYTGDLGD